LFPVCLDLSSSLKMELHIPNIGEFLLDRYILEDSTRIDSYEDFLMCIYLLSVLNRLDRLCGLVVIVLGYRSVGPGSIPGTTREKSSWSGTGSTQPREYNCGAI
jgi:hypothetical protein